MIHKKKKRRNTFPVRRRKHKRWTEAVTTHNSVKTNTIVWSGATVHTGSYRHVLIMLFLQVGETSAGECESSRTHTSSCSPIKWYTALMQWDSAAASCTQWRRGGDLFIIIIVHFHPRQPVWVQPHTQLSQPLKGWISMKSATDVHGPQVINLHNSHRLSTTKGQNFHLSTTKLMTAQLYFEMSSNLVTY